MHSSKVFQVILSIVCVCLGFFLSTVLFRDPAEAGDSASVEGRGKRAARENDATSVAAGDARHSDSGVRPQSELPRLSELRGSKPFPVRALAVGYFLSAIERKELSIRTREALEISEVAAGRINAALANFRREWFAAVERNLTVVEQTAVLVVFSAKVNSTFGFEALEAEILAALPDARGTIVSEHFSKGNLPLIASVGEEVTIRVSHEPDPNNGPDANLYRVKFQVPGEDTPDHTMIFWNTASWNAPARPDVNPSWGSLKELLTNRITWPAEK